MAGAEAGWRGEAHAEVMQVAMRAGRRGATRRALERRWLGMGTHRMLGRRCTLPALAREYSRLGERPPPPLVAQVMRRRNQVCCCV